MIVTQALSGLSGLSGQVLSDALIDSFEKLQWSLDSGAGYENGLLDGISVLESLEDYDSYRAPLPGACYQAGGSGGSLFIPNKDDTHYFTYYNITSGSWVNPTQITPSGANALINVGANVKFRNIKLWSDDQASQADIEQELPFSTLPSNLVAWYHANETVGTLALDCLTSDASQVAAHITISHTTDSSIEFNPANVFGHTVSDGTDVVVGTIIPRWELDTTKDVTFAKDLQYLGQCPYPMSIQGAVADLDGSSDYITTVPSNRANMIGDRTWFVRFIPDAVTGTDAVKYRLISQGSGTSTRLCLGIDNQKIAIGYNDGSFSGAVEFGDALSTGEYHSVAIVYDVSAGTIKVFIDGVYIDEETGVGSLLSTDTVPITIGANTSSGFRKFDGRVFDVMLLPSLLSDAQILQLHNQELQPTTGYQYRLSEGSGSVAYNHVANSDHGTIAGSVWGSQSEYQKDHCVTYGGRLESGAFVPGLLGGSGAANGSALSIQPGPKSPNALIDRDPYGAAELSGYQMTPYDSSVIPQDDLTPNDTMFERASIFGSVDRIVTTPAAVTGNELDNFEQYTSPLSFLIDSDVLNDSMIMWG